jgi:hypothetical protein
MSPPAPTPTPTLYVGQVSNVLGSMPLMPLFLVGNATLTVTDDPIRAPKVSA